MSVEPQSNVNGAAQTAGGVLLVVNRRSGGGSNVQPVIDVLAAAGVYPDVLEVEEPATLAAQIERESRNAARILVAGGDGTINAALPGLLAAAKPVGIVPLGTANDLARTLGLPTDPADAAAVALRGRTRRIDVGRVNGKPFLNAAGIGFSTQLQQLPARFKGVLGPLAYPLGVLRRWRGHRPFRATVRGAGIRCTRRVIQVTVANGRYYGGGMTAREDARIDDGRLDVLLILPRPFWRLLLSALSFKRGVYGEAAPVVAFRGREFEVTTRRLRPVASDGELSTVTPAVFDVVPAALEVCVDDEPDQRR